MRELIYVAPKKLEWRESAAPTIENSKQALVRPIAVATCDLDSAIVHGRTPFPAPFALGHESVGQVIEVGDAVTGVRPGDRVVVPFQPSCGTCVFCARGLTSNCVSVPRTSMYGIGAAGGNWGGTLADLIRIPFADHMLVKLDPCISPSVAASAGDNIADAWRTVAPPLGRRPGASVLILSGSETGGGSIPLYAVCIALALGAETVDFFCGNQQRVDKARTIGANAELVKDWPKRLGSYAVTVDSSGSKDGLACALRSTEPGGYCTGTSMYFDDLVPVPMLEMYMKGITLSTGRVNSRTVLPDVLELIQSRRILPELVTTEEARWDEAAEALLNYTTKLIISRDS